MSRSDRGGLPDQPRATGAPSVIPAPPASFLRPLRHSCGFLRRQESMRPINRATSLHPPDGPPEPPPRVIGRRRTLGVPLTPTDRLDSCLRRNDGGGGGDPVRPDTATAAIRRRTPPSVPCLPQLVASPEASSRSLARTRFADPPPFTHPATARSLQSRPLPQRRRLIRLLPRQSQVSPAEMPVRRRRLIDRPQ